LILGFVLANDMKAEASWALIGLTCRLAQALGLHRERNEYSRLTQATPLDDLPKRKLWYGVTKSFSKSNLMFTGGPSYGKTAYYLSRSIGLP
jgi:hypothetical protein